jgi:NOL1/NOP2/fmu family ribosome biogenesis protein
LLALAACGADGPLPAADAAGEILVCDLCAAPGGKATALLEMLGNRGFLLANEPIRSRVPPLSYNLARTGSDRYAVSSMDPDALADRLAGQFDLVLVDAPCSGQALLARGRQSAAALTSRQILHSAARQRRILSAAVRLTRPNGRLIYSTCTFAEAENEQQMQLLVEQNAVNPYPVDRLESYQCQAACYRLWPQRHQCAGSFTASMQVVSGDSASWSAGRRPRRKQTAKPPADLRRWFAVDEEQLRLDSREAAILGWPADAPEWLERIAMGGPELMHRTGQTWKPSHAAALRRVDRARSLRSIEVDDATAKEFLSGRPIPCHSTGWQVVRHQGRPLGWIKAGSGIGKNHLPQAARLMGPWLG